MSRISLTATPATGHATYTPEAWVRPDRLAARLAAFTAGEAEMRSMLNELGMCPYRSGFLGAGAPVLPSPDELSYVTKILARVSACLDHALGSVLPQEVAAVGA